MRLSRTMPLLLATILCVGLYLPTLFAGPEKTTEPVTVNPLGGPMANLPVCLHEDGSGMALCEWQGTGQGNGEGKHIISGDCAPDYVGGMDMMRMCISLYELHPYSKDDVQDCNDEYIPNIIELKKCYSRFMQQ